MRKIGLTGNQLKLIALVTMTIDHMGMILFPHSLLLRIIGRLAFPIYAYMIAEGCRYTRSMPRYLGLLASVAAVCQGVYWVAMGSVYQCILVTFSLAVCLIMLAKRAMQTQKVYWYLALAAGIVGVFLITEILPGLLPGTDFSVDYGFWGVFMPLLAFLPRETWGQKLLFFGGMFILAIEQYLGGGFTTQFWSALAIPILVAYNGKPGKLRMKWFFYIFYPAHMAFLYLLSFLI